MIIAAWYMIKNKIDYQDLGALHFLQRVHPARQANRLVNQLQQLGYQVPAQPARNELTTRLTFYFRLSVEASPLRRR
jgi:hypothetical protein